MDTIDPLRFVLASVFVLGLLWVFAISLKKFGQKALSTKLGGEGRISVIETRYIDAKNKILLIRKDEKEFLLLISEGKASVLDSSTTSNNS